MFRWFLLYIEVLVPDTLVLGQPLVHKGGFKNPDVTYDDQGSHGMDTKLACTVFRCLWKQQLKENTEKILQDGTNNEL
jgi:hypothetical protein